MKVLKNTYFAVFQIVTVFLGFAAILHSQEERRYEGPLEVGQYSGEASYGYRVIDGDTLLNGTFQMGRSDLQALLENEDSSFTFQGAFKNDYPNGFWRFQFGQFQSESKSQVVDFQYRVKVSGVQEQASGVLQKGKPNGKWIYTVNKIKDSEVEKTLFNSAIEFENGLPQRSFRVAKDSSTLVGRFLRNGLAHDEWSLFSTSDLEETESWTFSDGMLNKIIREEENAPKEILVFQEAYGTTTVINLDSRYIKTLQMHLPSTDSVALFEVGLPKLLKENARYYKKIDTILSKLGKATFLPEFKVKVPYYPIDSLELAQLDSLTLEIRNSKAIVDSFLNDSHLNILKLSDEQAQYFYHLIEAISENYINQLLNVDTYKEDDIIEFISREGLKQNLWQGGFPSKEIKVETLVDSLSSTKTYELPNSSRINFEDGGLDGISEISKYASQALKAIEKELSTKLSLEKRQLELVALEEQLILQNNELKQLLDSTDSKLIGQYKKALRNIKAVTDKDLSDFSNQEELGAAQELVKCHEQMNLLATSVANLPEKSKEITDAYLDRIWNPFMATLMDEEVKKRITTAYRKVLIPYFLERVQSDLNCSNVQLLLSQIEGTNQRMAELRNENTSKLERKLRKEDDPNVVMELFGIPQVKNLEN